MKWFSLFVLILLVWCLMELSVRAKEDDALSIDEYFRKHPRKFKKEGVYYDILFEDDNGNLKEVSEKAHRDPKFRSQAKQTTLKPKIINPSTYLEVNNNDKVALAPAIHDEKEIPQSLKLVHKLSFDDKALQQQNEEYKENPESTTNESNEKNDDRISINKFVIRRHRHGKGEEIADDTDHEHKKRVSDEYELAIDDFPKRHRHHGKGTHRHNKKKSEDNEIFKSYMSALRHHHRKGNHRHNKQMSTDYEMAIDGFPKRHHHHKKAKENSETSRSSDFLRDLLKHYRHHGHVKGRFNKSNKGHSYHHRHNNEESKINTPKHYNVNITEVENGTNHTGVDDIPVNYHVKFSRVSLKNYLRTIETGNSSNDPGLFQDKRGENIEKKEYINSRAKDVSGRALSKAENGTDLEKYNLSHPKFKRIKNLRQLEEEISKNTSRKPQYLTMEKDNGAASHRRNSPSGQLKQHDSEALRQPQLHQRIMDE